MYPAAPRPKWANEHGAGYGILVTYENHCKDRSHAGQQPVIDSV